MSTKIREMRFKDQTFFPHKKNKILDSKSEHNKEVNLTLTLPCFTGAIKDNTEAVNKMRERQDKTTELPSSLADDLKKRGDEQRVLARLA